MIKLYSALMPCEKYSKTIALIGQSLTGGDLLVIFQGFINHPCYLGYKGEVGYIIDKLAYPILSTLCFLGYKFERSIMYA